MSEVPEGIRPFQALGFGTSPAKVAGKEYFGDCPFCGKSDKMYVNAETGRWDCKSGSCDHRGNLFTFMKSWYDEIARMPSEAEWSRLGADRKIPPQVLKDAGIKRHDGKWVLPIYGKNGGVVNLRFYSFGGKLMGLPGMDSAIWNYDQAWNEEYAEAKLYICEGEWDAIALRWLLSREGSGSAVIGIPGASVFKDEWVKPFTDRDLTFCYDNDDDGRKGALRAAKKLLGVASKIRTIHWGKALPDKFDVRDFVTMGGTLEELLEMAGPVTDLKPAAKGKTKAIEVEAEKDEKLISDLPPLSSGKRPTYSETLARYEQYLYMNADLKVALKIIFAVLISNQMEGDPLWVHLASVPGSGKTELLSSCEQVTGVHFESSLTPHSLVSGWQGGSGGDPSLVPRLDGKTLILKDFTEILQMNRGSRDEIYGVLRGAFDGSVKKSYGNGIHREYKSKFNLVTGVTPSIFAESGASLGERFLICHLVKGVGFDADRQIEAALANVTNDNKMREDLQAAAEAFLEYRIDREDIPVLDREWTLRLVGLSQFVAMLRASVQRVFGSSDKLAYRAQHEMGTRIAKQLKKLLLGLAFLNYPATIDEEAYRIAVRVAMDTCIGFNLEIVADLFSVDGQTVDGLYERTKIPHSTIRDCLHDMEQLGIVESTKIDKPEPGRPQLRWWVTETIERHWTNAKLDTRMLREDVQAVAKVQTATRRMMAIKREGSGEIREQFSPKKAEERL